MTKLAGACAIAALEQPVEMRNIPKARSERDFGDRPVSGIAEQIAGADENPLVVDGRVDDGEISRPADLLVTTLRGAAHPFEVKINEAQVVRAVRDVRTQPQNSVLGCGDARNPDRSSVNL